MTDTDQSSTSVGSQSTIMANVAEPFIGTTQELIDEAERILALFKQNKDRLRPHHSDLPSPRVCRRVDPHALLEMMLKHAPNELGRRYVAKAICKCHRDDSSTLVDLSNTWLRYLLFPFKANRSSTSVPSSESTTPTLDTDTAYNLDPYPPGHNPNWFIHAPQNEDTLPLVVAHIIKGAIGIFDSNKDIGSFTTWDILTNFIGWDTKQTQEIVLKLDMPLNGMFLQHDLYYMWDEFAWTLKPVVDNGLVVPDTYDVEVIHPRGFPSLYKANGSPINRRITFQDRGGDQSVQAYMPEEDLRLTSHPRPLPDPELISLHQALCKVLHLSGAAEFINSVFRDLGEGGVELPSTKTL
ncbi:hypothetical protein Clacol_010352 [Clathrus columnatus]|uniref:HNH nuclease domain-containing protein n=1 Tax=Clathrus columnatus TaxID=1419009 RepID=A0AAV5ASU1_9AGAM|nr:hypothetical protein Clacol_010352 [Clathrus columnatus]